MPRLRFLLSLSLSLSLCGCCGAPFIQFAREREAHCQTFNHSSVFGWEGAEGRGEKKVNVLLGWKKCSATRYRSSICASAHSHCREEPVRRWFVENFIFYPSNSLGAILRSLAARHSFLLFFVNIVAWRKKREARSRRIWNKLLNFMYYWALANCA